MRISGYLVDSNANKLEATKSPCSDCPFRNRRFLRLTAADAAALIQFVEDGHTPICHRTLGKTEIECGGAVAFLVRDRTVFRDARAMIRAHRRSSRLVQGRLWGID